MKAFGENIPPASSRFPKPLNRAIRMSTAAERAWYPTPSTELAGLRFSDSLQKWKHSNDLVLKPAECSKLLTCTLFQVDFTRKSKYGAPGHQS